MITLRFDRRRKHGIKPRQRGERQRPPPHGPRQRPCIVPRQRANGPKNSSTRRPQSPPMRSNPSGERSWTGLPSTHPDSSTSSTAAPTRTTTREAGRVLVASAPGHRPAHHDTCHLQQLRAARAAMDGPLRPRLGPSAPSRLSSARRRPWPRQAQSLDQLPHERRAPATEPPPQATDSPPRSPQATATPSPLPTTT